VGPAAAEGGWGGARAAAGSGKAALVGERGEGAVEAGAMTEDGAVGAAGPSMPGT
jgi:hypothetical protein